MVEARRRHPRSQSSSPSRCTLGGVFGNFPCRVKKNPRRARPARVMAQVGMGRGSGGFLGRASKGFLLMKNGCGLFPPSRPSFFLFREVVENFTLLTRGLAMELLRLLCEGMGLPLDYFEGHLGGGYVTLDINHYPACPNPSITLGLPPHCDRDLMAVLLPGQVLVLRLPTMAIGSRFSLCRVPLS